MTQVNGELLAPIPGENPAGLSLRYDPVYDQIKIARREDDDLPQGDWQTARKAADWTMVIRLATDALSKKSKDLQIAAWLTEAWLRREGFGGLHRGLTLIHELLQQYWDTVYPVIEDGDAEIRAGPLEWIGMKFDAPVRLVPLNQEGHNFLQYRTSRSVPTREAADSDSSRGAAREEAIAEGKLTPEDFERGFAATAKAWYRQLISDIDASLRALSALDDFCREHFADVAPNVTPVRSAIEEVRQVASQLLARKLELEPDPIAPGGETSLPPAGASAVAASSSAPVDVSAGPRNRDEAAVWIAAAARQIRRERPAEPTAYLMLRGFRWGELRTPDKRIDPRMLVAPTTEVRTRLRGLLLDANWAALLDAAEETLAHPHGRGWLDLQRYAITAADAHGGEYEAVGSSIRGALRSLLADLPDLPLQTLMDDSPVANAETMAWLREEKLLPEGAGVPEAEERPRPAALGRDVHDVAMARVRAGDPRGAMELLMRESAREKSTRARFLRRSQAAEIMVGAGMEEVAVPILRELLDQIEAHRLEEWEAGDTVALPLDLLYRCALKVEAANVDANALYERVCRLDPVRAIRLKSQDSS